MKNEPGLEFGPEVASGRTARRPRSTWLVLVLVVNVCVGMAYSITTLRRSGDELSRAEAIVTEINGHSRLQVALGDQAMASRESGSTIPDQILDISREVTDRCERLEQLKGAEEIWSEVCPQTGRFQRAVAEEAHLLADGRFAAARSIADEEISSLALGMSKTLDRGAATARSEAQDAYRIADVESIIMMLFAAIMTALLFRRFEWARVSGDLKAARERAESEARFRSLVQNSSDLITIIDANGVIKYQSPSVERILGHDPDKAVGTRLESLLHPEDASEVLVDLQELVGDSEGMETVCEYRWAHSDGTWRHAENISANLLHDPHIGGVVINTRDITERKQTEEALRRSEKRYRRLIDTATDVVLTVSNDGKFTSLNPAFETITGLTRSEWIGREVTELVHPDDSPTVSETFKTLLQGERPKVCEVRFRSADGEYVDVDLAAAPQVEDGSVTGALVIARDVTEQRSLQQQLRQSQKMEAVGQLAGGIAHDFNNLLGVIQNYAAFLAEDLNDSDPRKADADEISKASERAAALTRQLLAFSRREVVKPEVLDLAEVVAGMKPMLRRMIMESIDLEVRTTAQLWRTRIDPGQLEQVILNLVVNARDAMLNGGKLIIGTSNVSVDDAFARQHPGLIPGDYVRLSITDNGHGMSDEVAARVFEPFFTTKPRDSGTGLGLATVYGIIKQAGGHTTLYSEPGKGATFHIYLPTTSAAVPESTPESSNGLHRGHGETIVVVEDEEGIRKLVDRILTRNGYKVLVARSGEEAVELVAAHKEELSLLLTDVVMPRMSGGELVEILRRSQPDLRVIYMSGYPDQTVIEHGVLEASEDYVQKPFSESELLQAVRRILDGAAVN